MNQRIVGLIILVIVFGIGAGYFITQQNQEGNLQGETSDDIVVGIVEIDEERIQTLQRVVDEGHQPWRLDPLQVAKVESLEYGFSPDDVFILRHNVRGTARIQAYHKEKDYILTLHQITQGDSQIWALRVIEDPNVFPQGFLTKAFADMLSKWKDERTCKEKQILAFWDVEFGAESVDLNEDGENEFIFMPSRLCESSFLYGSAGQESLVYQNLENSWQLIGSIWGEYQVTSMKTHGYRDITASVKRYGKEGGWVMEEEIWQWDGSHYILNPPEL